MNELPERRHDVPVLTEIIDSTAPASARASEGVSRAPSASDAPAAPAMPSKQELLDELLAHAQTLIDQAVRQAWTDLESQMQAQLSARIREQLPALIAKILHSHSGAADIRYP